MVSDASTSRRRRPDYQAVGRLQDGASAATAAVYARIRPVVRPSAAVTPAATPAARARSPRAASRAVRRQAALVGAGHAAASQTAKTIPRRCARRDPGRRARSRPRSPRGSRRPPRTGADGRAAGGAAASVRRAPGDREDTPAEHDRVHEATAIRAVAARDTPSTGLPTRPPMILGPLSNPFAVDPPISSTAGRPWCASERDGQPPHPVGVDFGAPGAGLRPALATAFSARGPQLGAVRSRRPPGRPTTPSATRLMRRRRPGAANRPRDLPSALSCFWSFSRRPPSPAGRRRSSLGTASISPRVLEPARRLTPASGSARRLPALPRHPAARLHRRRCARRTNAAARAVAGLLRRPTSRPIAPRSGESVGRDRRRDRRALGQ